MKKFLTGLRYGNWYTRLYILAIPICLVVGIGLMVVSFFINAMLVFLAGVGIGIVGLALSQRFDIQEVTYVPSEKKGQKQSAKKTDYMKLKQGDEKRDTVTSSQENIASKGEADTEAKKAEELLSYDEKKIKQIFYRYKVRADHKTIMIDEWKGESIHQSPAYIWKQHRQFHILVVGEGVQEYCIPSGKLAVMKYHHGVICQAKQEYPQFRKESMMKQVFSPYLPAYHEGTKDGRHVIYKDLFELGDGLFITNTSAKAIMALVQPEFVVDDRIMRDAAHNAFFKEIYKQGILFREQVISPKEYKEQVNDYLENLAESVVSDEEYGKTLQELQQNRLISQEYVIYYKENREKLKSEGRADIKKPRIRTKKKGKR